MPTVAEDFRTLLLAQPKIYELVGERVHQDHVPSSSAIPANDSPYIWFSRSGAERFACLNDAQGTAPETETFNLEAWAESKTEADRLYDELQSLDGYTGAMGDRTVQVVYVDDPSDDYEPQGFGEAEGLAVTSLTVEIVP